MAANVSNYPEIKCEICNQHHKDFRLIFYPDWSPQLICVQCLAQPVNREILKNVHQFKIGSEDTIIIPPDVDVPKPK